MDRPIRIVVRLGARSAPGALLLGAGALASIVALIFGVTALPVLLFGDPLTEPEAERAIRTHLAAQAAVQRRSPPPEVAVIDVDKGIFGLLSFKGSYVAKASVRERAGHGDTRYFCFRSHFLLGECGAWSWLLAL